MTNFYPEEERTMTVIQPTVGRVVHYEPAPSDPGFHLCADYGKETQAALIVFVNDDGTVNLGVFDKFGHTYPKQRVPLIQDGEPSPENGYAHWMPYQVGQAAKTEQVQAELEKTKKPSKKAKEVVDDDI